MHSNGNRSQAHCLQYGIMSIGLVAALLSTAPVAFAQQRQTPAPQSNSLAKPSDSPISATSGANGGLMQASAPLDDPAKSPELQWLEFIHSPAGLLTLATTLGALSQAVFAGLQWKVYRQQAALMIAQVEISKTQAQVQDTLLLQKQRAILYYHDIECERIAARDVGAHPDWRIIVHWRNFGQLAALSVEPRSYSRIIPAGEFDAFKPQFATSSGRSHLSIPPQGDFAAGTFIIPYKDIIETINSSSRLVCCICVFYRNILEREREYSAELCFEVVLHGQDPDEELHFPVLAQS